MLDKLGTLLGMLFGIALVFFGIVWPDHLSNYYMYMFREFETGLETLKATQATSEELRNHKEIFKGYENYLPTFNIRTIETAFHRIRNLSEHFIYFNDD